MSRASDEGDDLPNECEAQDDVENRKGLNADGKDAGHTQHGNLHQCARLTDADLIPTVFREAVYADNRDGDNGTADEQASQCRIGVWHNLVPLSC
jgi:hypothetical protein